MAPVWNAVALALRPDGGAALDRFARRVERAPAAVARVAADVLLAGRAPGQALAVATVSASGTVRACLGELSRRCRLQVLCAEGRPLLEGRALAASLAAAGIAVTLCTAAAAGGLSGAADTVLVGVDAVGPDWFVNKCGTRALVEAAAARGRAAYAAAARDKFIAAPLAARLTPGGGLGRRARCGGGQLVLRARPGGDGRGRRHRHRRRGSRRAGRRRGRAGRRARAGRAARRGGRAAHPGDADRREDA